MEYPIATLNSQLIGAGLNPNDPANTYVDFATQLAKNQRDQAEMEQTLAQAKQRVAQGAITTQQMQQAQKMGVNPLTLNTETPEQANVHVKALLTVKGLLNDETSKAIDTWTASLTGPINKQESADFASRLMGERTKLGPPFVASATDAKSDKQDENGDPLVEGQTYSALYDMQGNVSSYLRSGQEKVAPSTGKTELKTEEDKNRAWERLGTQLTIAFKTRSGGLGAVSTSIFRAVRAINSLKLYTYNLTAQDLENIAQDIGAIFQGGAPTVESAKGNNYQTIFSKMQNEIRQYIGEIMPIPFIHETVDKMLEVLEDLRDSAIQNLDKYAEFQSEVFSHITKADPKHWQEVKQKYIDLASSGLLIPPGENPPLNITGGNIAVPSKSSQAKTSAGATTSTRKPLSSFTK